MIEELFLFILKTCYNITTQIFVFLEKKPSNTKALKNHSKRKERLRQCYFFYLCDRLVTSC